MLKPITLRISLPPSRLSHTRMRLPGNFRRSTCVTLLIGLEVLSFHAALSRIHETDNNSATEGHSGTTDDGCCCCSGRIESRVDNDEDGDPGHRRLALYNILRSAAATFGPCELWQKIHLLPVLVSFCSKLISFGVLCSDVVCAWAAKESHQLDPETTVISDCCKSNRECAVAGRRRRPTDQLRPERHFGWSVCVTVLVVRKVVATGQENRNEARPVHRKVREPVSE